MSVVQLAFDMSLNTVYRWENFYISPSNDSVITMIKRWPSWNNNIQLICGASKSGKTHIANLWQSESKACFVDDNVLQIDFLTDYVAENRNLILEDADTINNSKGLFHLYNLVNEYEGFLLMTAKKPPHQWSIKLPDLVSRLNSVAISHIESPDDDLLEALLIKQFADLQLKVPEHVLSFILKNIHRSYGTVYDVCHNLNNLSIERRCNLTIPLVKQVISIGNA